MSTKASEFEDQSQRIARLEDTVRALERKVAQQASVTGRRQDQQLGNLALPLKGQGLSWKGSLMTNGGKFCPHDLGPTKLNEGSVNHEAQMCVVTYCVRTTQATFQILCIS